MDTLLHCEVFKKFKGQEHNCMYMVMWLKKFRYAMQIFAIFSLIPLLIDVGCTDWLDHMETDCSLSVIHTNMDPIISQYACM